MGAFLPRLETDRANAATPPPARLAAIHSFFRSAALRDPEHAALIQRILAIPPKRLDRAIVSYLTAPECDALIAAADRTSWLGRRDHALLSLATETGLRVSALTGLTRADVQLETEVTGSDTVDPSTAVRTSLPGVNVEKKRMR